MAVVLNASHWANLVAGVLVATFGLALIVLRGRVRPALALGTFFAALGVAFAITAPPAAFGRRLEVVTASMRLLSAVALVLLFAWTPGPLTRRDRTAVVGALVAGVAYVAFSLARPIFQREPLAWDGVVSPLSVAAYVSRSIQSAALAATFVGFPLRFRAAEDMGARRTLALLGAGLAIFAAPNAASILAPVMPLGSLVSVGLLLVVTSLWLAGTAGPASRLARNVAITIPAAMLATMIVALLVSDGFAAPIARIAGLALLTYAVLRGLIAGLDTKVHFAISKGTVAAIFVVVFFLASELAQQFFAQRYTAIVGIVASGMLVFALAPLHRVAERLAERAVPVAGAPPPIGGADVYKAALRAAMRDGVITRREEKHLAEVARGLGLDPVQAHELRDAVEGEDLLQS